MDADTPPPTAQDLEVELGQSDNRILYILYGLIVLMGIFVVWTSWEQTRANERHHEIIAMLEQQNRDLLCFVDATYRHEIAVAQVLVEQDTAPSEEQLEAQINELRQRVVASKAVCLAAMAATATPTTTAP